MSHLPVASMYGVTMIIVYTLSVQTEVARHEMKERKDEGKKGRK